MIRHELKDGKWYLIRSQYSFKLAWCDNSSDKAQERGPRLYVSSMIYRNRADDEWVEIDPEMIFKFISNGMPGL